METNTNQQSVTPPNKRRHTQTHSFSQLSTTIAKKINFMIFKNGHKLGEDLIVDKDMSFETLKIEGKILFLLLNQK